MFSPIALTLTELPAKHKIASNCRSSRRHITHNVINLNSDSGHLHHHTSSVTNAISFLYMFYFCLVLLVMMHRGYLSLVPLNVSNSISSKGGILKHATAVN